MPPVFEFTDHFDSSVTIFGRECPVQIKRYTRAESDALYLRSQELGPRGTAEPDADRDAAAKAFFEQVITDAVTLEPDVIVDRGRSLTTGADMIELFYNRQDVLAAFAAQVIIENRMMPSLAKNLSSPRGSDTGSEQSIPTRGGDRQGSTVTSVDASSSVEIAAATAESSAAESEAPASSGEASAAMALA